MYRKDESECELRKPIHFNQPWVCKIEIAKLLKNFKKSVGNEHNIVTVRTRMHVSVSYSLHQSSRKWGAKSRLRNNSLNDTEESS